MVEPIVQVDPGSDAQTSVATLIRVAFLCNEELAFLRHLADVGLVGAGAVKKSLNRESRIRHRDNRRKVSVSRATMLTDG